MKVFKTVSILLTMIASSLASAEVVLIVRPTNLKGISEMGRVLKHPLVQSSEPLFSAPEISVLTSLLQKELVATCFVTVRKYQDVKTLKRWVRKAGLNIEIDQNSFPLQPFEEPLEELQWGLHNSGVKLRYEIADLLSIDLPTRIGEDIGLKGAPAENPSGKKVRVAVLDTGIDYDHPNLKSQVVRNPEECAVLEKYRECLKKEAQEECDKKWASIDSNQDGYPLDCSGWNLTIGKNKVTGIYGNFDAKDDTGHGTHISGIIAAAANGTGIRGISQNVEILPIKVIRTSPNAPIRPQSLETDEPPPPDSEIPPTAEKELGWTTGFADVLARGVLYAIRSNAQIINISLGWTAGADSLFMRKMVALAQSRGILVVAAAGNDSSDARVMPCQYDGVVCVASHNPDGALSHFSNYGSFVDLAAPGMKILSTWPTVKRSYDFTKAPGYEFKNGTSMSTPFVVGALARLLAAGVSPQEAVSKLLAGTRPFQPSQQKYLRAGNLDLARSFQVAARPLILPERKLPILLSWDRSHSEIPFSFSLKNFWAKGKNVHVSAEIKVESSLSMGRLGTSQWNIMDWEAGAAQTFSSSLIIVDKRIDGRLLLEIVVQADGVEAQTFRIPVEISVPIDPTSSGTDIQTFPIVGASINPNSSLRTITSLDGKTKQDYVAIEESQTSTKIQLIEQIGTEYKITAQIETAPSRDDLMVLHRIDQNQDGKSEYIFVYRTQPSEGTTLPGFRFQYFDDKLQLLNTIDYDNKTSVISERFKWLHVKEGKEGEKSSLVPLWLALGKTPALDKPPFDPWDPDPKDISEQRLYYLSSDGLHTIQIPEPYALVQVLTQSSEHVANGKVSLIVSKGNDYKLTFYVAELDGNKFGEVSQISLSRYRMLLGLDNIVDVTPLDSQAEIKGTALAGGTGRGNQRTTFILPPRSGNESISVIDGTQGAGTHLDSVMTISAAYAGNQRKATFAQTHYRLAYQDMVSGEVAFTDLDRFTFLPNFIFSKTMFPVVVGDGSNSDRLPGILIPASLGISDASEVVIPVYNPTDQKLLGLAHPARLRFVAGEGCDSMGNTIKASASSPTQAVFFCGDRFHRISLHD